jgi:cytoskeleton protein RodZ
MTEPKPVIFSSRDAGSRSAGEILRLAREAQNQTLEGLASTIKVAPAKLDALERGQLDRLPDASFTRALAMTVCRALKLEPTEVLAALPAARPTALAEGKPPLNQPFKDVRGGSPLFDRSWDWSALLSFKWLAPAVLLAGAVAIYVLPESANVPAWLHQVFQSDPGSADSNAIGPSASSASVPQASATEESGMAPVAAGASVTAVSTLEAASLGASGAVVLDSADASASTPIVAGFVGALSSVVLAEPGGHSASAAVSSATLVLVVTEASWIRVRDAKGIKLLSQRVSAGETLSITGAPPFKALIGNAAGVTLTYKGQPVDLVSQARNNVARVELK